MLKLHADPLSVTEDVATAKTVNLVAGREVCMAELKDVIRQLRAQLEEAGLEPGADDPLLTGQTGET